MIEPFQSLTILLGLARRVRQARKASELAFILVNDSHELSPYRQAALWSADSGLRALSGLVQVEANAPYVLWLDQLCHHFAANESEAVRTFTAGDVPPSLTQQWGEWLPTYALWLRLEATGLTGSTGSAGSAGSAHCGLLLARDTPWSDAEQSLLCEWADIWTHADAVLNGPHTGFMRTAWRGLCAQLSWRKEREWWRQSALLWIALLCLVLAFPVQLTVLAPGELVPARPVVIRSPLDGVLEVFHVQPNQLVKKNQPLFGFDEALIKSRLDVAAQNLTTTEVEYRQTSQQALIDAKFRSQLALLTGKIEEKRAEVGFLREQLTRSLVLAPQDGVVLIDDPSEWIGRPVSVGERILRIAVPSELEVEAWLPLADAIALEPGAQVNLYLNASPLNAVTAHLRYMAHDAVQRPDLSYAYRVRATLEAPTEHRVGLKGTAKLHGERVPLVYWMLRRPMAALRSWLGL